MVTKTELYKVLCVCCGVVFIAAYSLSFPVTYIPAMTLWLGFTQEDMGYYVEIIMSTYYIGACLTNYLFGWLSDKYGHLKLIWIILLTNTLYCVVFSISTNLPILLISHLLMGTCHALAFISKSLVCIYSDDKTHALSMAVIQMSDAIGFKAGYIIGGYLANPWIAYNHDIFNIHLFKIFPYFLPPFIGSVGSLLMCFVIGYASRKFKKRTMFETNHDDINNSEDTYPINTKNEINYKSTSNHGDQTKHYTDRRTFYEENSKHRSSYKKIRNYCEIYLTKILRHKEIIYIIIVYSLRLATRLTYAELLSTWATTSMSFGGLDYSTKDIADTLSYIILPCTILVTFTVSFLTHHIGAKYVLIISNLVLMIATSLTALCRLIQNTTVQFITLMAMQSVVLICDLYGAVGNMVLLNNSVRSEYLARLNGAGQTVTMLTKFLYSLLSGSIYTWTVENETDSFIDISVPFVVNGFVVFILVIIAIQIPITFNKKQIE